MSEPFQDRSKAANRPAIRWPRALVRCALVSCALAPSGLALQENGVGSILGVVHDADVDSRLADVEVSNITLGRGNTVTTTDQGNYVFSGLPPGRMARPARLSR